MVLVSLLSEACGGYSVSLTIFSSHLYEIFKLSAFNNDEQDQDWSLQQFKKNYFISVGSGRSALKF